MSFMATEIAETGAAIRRQLAANARAVAGLAAELRAGEPSFVATIARGSSDHAALFLKHVIELKIGLACASLGPSIASLYRAPLRLDRAVAITISQSGRSPDIVAMQQAAKQAGATTIAFVNDAASPAARDADALLPLHAGEERSVAATKSMIASLVAGLRSPRAGAKTPASPPRSIACPRFSKPRGTRRRTRPSRRWRRASSLYVIGRGATFAVAAEAALKLKETSAIHAEAFSSAEVLHGPAGVIVPGFPILCFAPADAARDGFFETVDRLESFGAAPLMVDVAPHPRWPTLVAPDGGHALTTPIAALHAFYRLAEAVARRRGRDPDQPPHLMKVTRTV